MSAQQPVERAAVASRDLGEVHELIRRRYVENLPRIVGPTDGFAFRSEAASAGGLSIDRIAWWADMSIATDPFETTVVATVLDGTFHMRGGRLEGRGVRGDSLLYPSRAALQVLMERVTCQVVQLPAAAIDRVAARAGVDPVDLRFDGMAPVSPAAGRQWLATIAYLSRLLAGAGPAGIHPFMLSAAIDAAATAALTVFPNTTMTVDAPGPGRVAPAAVRRAVAHIEAHAGEPITVEDVAAAAGLGVRALQAAFRKHLDTTPVAYLARVRLERAHHELRAAGPGVTVAEVAHRWGFGDLGRFAARYRAAFGRLPSHTLRT
ncbi:hypothetical protein Val02_04600 [Virgisporangium aliadipatigenens]|uniref:HTH araC/xylS-type domain-containing protein n=1 Tax=Virgisporangium aliadipatigenens TaxID=741659 RepID=A0A8J3YEB8_9ACTN|nr:AraC family transcriptional regulator [Virgisporangium aliadipatigenens]GIJ43574.1 hypothetical protein Val02_04600 [Virgisporangium aliadipatigenens]